MNNKTEEDFKNLEFIRIFDPIHIPEYLVDQIRDKEFTTERFYEYQKKICIQKEGKNYFLNPFNLLFVITEPSKKVVGFVWMVVDSFSESLVINSFSMDKEYWVKGKAVQMLKEKAIEIAKGAQLKKIYWITNHPKHSKKHGFKTSKSVLMEFKLEEEKEDGKNIYGIGCETSGDSRSFESSAAAIPEQYTGTSSRTSSPSVREFVTGF